VRTAATLLVLGILLGRGAMASAQSPPDEATNTARLEFAQGVEAFEAERFDVALGHFRKAWQLRPHPTVRVNLASCYAKLGKAPAAVMHYRAYLADRSVQVSAAARRDIRTALRPLEARVGILDLILSPPDATIRVDGTEPEARDGSRLFVGPGAHRIEARAPGRSTTTRVVEVDAGSTQSVSIELAVETVATAPTPPPPPAGEARSDPVVRQEPATSPSPPDDAGENDAPAPDEDTGSTFVETPADGPAGGGSSGAVLRWGAFGLAGAAAIGAAVLGVLALGADGDFDDKATRIESHDYATESERATIERQARDDASRADSLALLTDVCIGVAVAAAVTGTVLLLTAPSAPSEDEARADLRLSAAIDPRGGAGVLVTGAF